MIHPLARERECFPIRTKHLHFRRLANVRFQARNTLAGSTVMAAFTDRMEAKTHIARAGRKTPTGSHQGVDIQGMCGLATRIIGLVISTPSKYPANPDSIAWET